MYQRIRVVSVGAALVAVLAGAPLCAEELYKWVDEQGNLQLSDRPPEEVPAAGYEGPQPRTVGQHLEAERRALIDAAREAALAGGEEPLEGEQEAAAEGQPTQAQAAAEPAQKYSCDEARDFVAYYAKREKNLFLPTKGGSLRPVTDADFDALIAQWQAAEAVLCKPPPTGEGEATETAEALEEDTAAPELEDEPSEDELAFEAALEEAFAEEPVEEEAALEEAFALEEEPAEEVEEVELEEAFEEEPELADELAEDEFDEPFAAEPEEAELEEET